MRDAEQDDRHDDRGVGGVPENERGAAGDQQDDDQRIQKQEEQFEEAAPRFAGAGSLGPYCDNRATACCDDSPGEGTASVRPCWVEAREGEVMFPVTSSSENLMARRRLAFTPPQLCGPFRELEARRNERRLAHPRVRGIPASTTHGNDRTAKRVGAVRVRSGLPSS